MKVPLIPKTNADILFWFICLQIVLFEEDVYNHDKADEIKRKLINFVKDRIPEYKQTLNNFRQLIPATLGDMSSEEIKRYFFSKMTFECPAFIESYTKTMLASIGASLSGEEFDTLSSVWDNMLSIAEAELAIVRTKEKETQLQEHYSKTGGAGGRKSRIYR